jgi:hypothetical protein
MHATSVEANSATLAQAGNWRAYTATSDEGETICGIAQFNNNSGFLIKYGFL